MDTLYADYDEPEEDKPNFSESDFAGKLDTAKSYLLEMERDSGAVTRFASTVANFYTLWAVVVLEHKVLPRAPKAAKKYQAFMEKVELVGQQGDLETFLKSPQASELQGQLHYWNNVRGANTDLKQREARSAALLKAMQD